MIKLASNYVPYNFTEAEFEIVPMKGQQLSLLSKAVLADDISYALQAVDQIINQDINTITIPDFYHILMYARFQSMPASGVEIAWDCNGSMYRAETSGIDYNLLQLEAMNKAFEMDPENNPDPEKLIVEEVDCGKHVEQELRLNDFHILELPADTALEPGFDFPRCNILPSLLEAYSDPERVLIAGAAQWLQGGENIDDKINAMNNSDGLGLYDELSKLNARLTYGVKQKLPVICPKCGTKHQVAVVLTPELFFRF